MILKECVKGMLISFAEDTKMGGCYKHSSGKRNNTKIPQEIRNMSRKQQNPIQIKHLENII